MERKLATQIFVAFSDSATADAAQRELASHGFSLNRISRNRAIQFGMKIGPIEGSAQEFIELLEAAPNMVDVLFDIYARLKARLFVDNRQVRVTNKEDLRLLLSSPTGLKKPKTFQDMFGKK